MNKPLVSFIIPCYNCEKYLNKLLDSMLNQTLKNIEIICINDGSKDNTLKILKFYEQNNKQVKVIDKKNGGQYKARKDGVFAAQGKYIGFLDSDDYVESTYAEKLYHAMVDNDADISVCGYSRIDFESGKILKKEMCNPKYDVVLPKENPGLLLEINSSLWNKLFKAEIVRKCLFFDTAPKGYEDMVLLQYVYLYTNKIIFVKEPLYNYMIIKTSTINNIKKELVSEMFSSLTDIKQKYLNENVSDDFINYCDANAFLHLGISIPFRLLSDKTVDFSSNLKSITNFLNGNNKLWKKNKFISLKYILKNKKTNFKLFIVQKVYKLHLMKMFIKIYNFLINKLGIDIKW